MIFNVPGHIDMIRNGLRKHPPISSIPPRFYVKTQTRRIKRSYYQIESKRKKPHKIGYAVQRKRGVKAEQDIRIVMDRIWHETYFLGFDISKKDALAEGGYTPEQYEKIFQECNKKWNGRRRWVFEFHVIKMEKEIL